MWVDDTQAVSVEDYLRAENRFYDAFRQNNDVVAFGKFGSVKAPGLSDLDLIVVVKDEAIRKGLFHFPKIKNIEEYLFVHLPMLIPESLLGLLHYYHLIKVVWAENVPSIFKNHDDIERATVNNLHVFAKTIYLQSFLWRFMYRNKKPCRRGIIALTSIARSIQWMKSNAVQVSEEEELYVELVLGFRDRWVSEPEARKSLIKELDGLLMSALRISIELPERLVFSMLEGHDVYLDELPCLYDRFQYKPMHFVLEAPVNKGEKVLDIVKSDIFYSSCNKILGRASGLLLGSFSIVGPATSAVLRSELDVNREYNRSIGCLAKEESGNDSIRRSIDKTILPIIKRKYEVNYSYAEILINSGYANSNFSSVWMATGNAKLRGMLISKLSDKGDFTRFIQKKLKKEERVI